MINVIIVEDEIITREGLEVTVDWSMYGCRIVGTAADGLEGEKLILRKRPDIVITDIRMPNKGGLEMMEALQHKINTNYIILSGFDDFKYAKQAITLGAKGYLLKPIDDGEFEQVLYSVIATLGKNKDELDKVSYVKIHKSEKFSNLLSNKYLKKAFEFLKCRYMEDLTIKYVADKLLISESYLGKLFKNKTSHTFLFFLTLYRLKAAINLLETTDLKIYEIANAVGYEDSKYFSKIFSKMVGVKPTEYRNGYELEEESPLNLIP